MSRVGYFECSIDLGDRRLTLGADCVGLAIPFVYKNHKYHIHLPYFDTANTKGYFGHPKPTAKGTKIGLNWLHDGAGIHMYGEEYRRTATGEVLGFRVSKFIVRSRKPVTPAVARQMKMNLAVWQNIFLDWLEVLEYKDLEDGGVDFDKEGTLHAYFIPSDGKNARRVKTRGEFTSSIVVRMSDDLSASQLRRALRKVDTGSMPPLYYQQLMSALRHHNGRRYRQSVLDTATAVELALTQLLEERLSGVSVVQRRKLMKRFRMLSGLELGLATLGFGVPPEISTMIGRPRNAAMHRGELITAAQSRDALNVAKSFIYDILPL